MIVRRVAVIAVVGLQGTSAFVPQTYSSLASRPSTSSLHVASAAPPADVLEEVDALMEEARALEEEAKAYEEEAKMLEEQVMALEEQLMEKQADEDAKKQEDIEKSVQVIMGKETADVKGALEEAQKKTRSLREMLMNAAPVQEETKPAAGEEEKAVAMDEGIDKFIAEKEAEAVAEETAAAKEKLEQQTASQQQPVKSRSLREIMMMNNAAPVQVKTKDVAPVVEEKMETKEEKEEISMDERNEEFVAKGEIEATAVFYGLQKNTPKSTPPPQGIKMKKAEPYKSFVSFDEGTAVAKALVDEEKPVQQTEEPAVEESVVAEDKPIEQSSQQQQDVTKPAKSMSLKELMMMNNI